MGRHTRAASTTRFSLPLAAMLALLLALSSTPASLAHGDDGNKKLLGYFIGQLLRQQTGPFLQAAGDDDPVMPR
jgi:hypothetical protein